MDKIAFTKKETALATKISIDPDVRCIRTKIQLLKYKCLTKQKSKNRELCMTLSNC